MNLNFPDSTDRIARHGYPTEQRIFRHCPLAVVVALTMLVVVALVAPRDAKAGVSPHQPGQVVLRLAPALGAVIDTVNDLFGTSVVETFPGRDDTYLLQVPGGTDLDMLLANLNALPIVLYAERNWRNDVSLEGNAFRSYATGGMDSAPLDGQRWIEVLGLNEAHLISQGEGTRIAVLDTGFDVSHPLYASQLLAGFDFVDNDSDPSPALNTVDDDGDGLIDEGEGHGTHVAGILAQLAPAAEILPLRVLDSDGVGNDWRTAKAIHNATALGANAVNLSLMSYEQSALLADLIEEATFAGVSVAAAAGNQASDVFGFPAADACSLAVAAADGIGRPAPFASYGDWVTLAAPGQSIYSALPGATYGWWSGSSQAVPFVAAASSLLRERFAALSAVQRADLLAATTFTPFVFGDGLEDGLLVGPGELGAGLLNLFAAVDYDIGQGLPLPLPEPLPVWCAPEGLGYLTSLNAGGAAVELAASGVVSGSLSLPLEPEASYSGAATLRPRSNRLTGLSASLAGEEVIEVDSSVVAVSVRRPPDPPTAYAALGQTTLNLSLTPLVPLFGISADAVEAHAEIGGDCDALNPIGTVQLTNAVVTTPLGGSIDLPANPPPNFEVDLSMLPGNLAGVILTLNDQTINGDGANASLISVTAVNITLDVDVIGLLTLGGEINLGVASAEIDCSQQAL